MSDLAEPAPQTLDTPEVGGERDAAIALVQQAAAERAKVGERPEAKPAKGKAGKAAAKAAEAEPAPEAEEAVEGEPDDATDGVEAEPEEAVEEEKPAERKTPPWKAYERKKATLKEDRANLDRAKAELNAKANDHARNGALVQELERVKSSGDAVAWLEAGGFTYRQATEAVLKQKNPSDPVTREELESKERSQARAGVEQQFVSLATDVSSYPDAALFGSKFGSAEIVAAGNEASDQLRQELGRKPSFVEVAARVNAWAKSYHDEIRGHAGPGTAPPARKTGPGEQAKPSATRAPKTLSQRHAAESSGRPVEETDAQRAERARTLLAGIRKR